jgi:hypothetical protein
MGGLVVAAVMAATVSGWAGGGDMLYPARDRYEPGQEVTMVGYTADVADQDWRGAEPFYAWLASEGSPDRTRLARVGIEAPADAPDGRPLRVGVTFRLPSGLAPGRYWVDVCDAGCDTYVGWLMGGPLSVGVDPLHPVVREWPLTDPAVRWLADDALLVGPGMQVVTAAQARSGQLPEPVVPSTSPPPPEPAGDDPAGDPAGARPSGGAGDGDDAGAGSERAEGERAAAVRTGGGGSGAGSGEVLAWSVAGVLLLGVWLAAWRLRPRITVR